VLLVTLLLSETILRRSAVTTQIEIYDQKRKRYRGGGLVGSVIFLFAWIGYVVTRLSSLRNDFFRTVIMVVLILAVIFQAYYAIKNVRLEREIKKDPQLKDALNNEFVQHNELKAWRASFFSVIGFIVVSAILSIFIQINDIMLVFLTALLIGFGTHNAAVYLLDR
jgi:Ca2+/Na+ antiporter